MSWRPSSIVTSQRSAISIVDSSASGHSENARAISSVERRKNSLVSKVIFGAASVDFVCTHSSAVWWS
jgi:hypothetical protein